MTIELSLTRKRRLPVLAGGSYEGPLASLVRAKQIRDLVAARQLGIFLAAQLADWQQPVRLSYSGTFALA